MENFRFIALQERSEMTSDQIWVISVWNEREAVARKQDHRRAMKYGIGAGPKIEGDLCCYV